MAVVVISGANRGIGLGLCQAYKAKGDRVIALCRQTSEALSALDVEVIEGVDVGDPTAMVNLVEAMSGVEQIDILINVAGIWRRETIDDMNFNTILEQFDINSLGPLRVTMALLPKLKQGSKSGDDHITYGLHCRQYVGWSLWLPYVQSCAEYRL